MEFKTPYSLKRRSDGDQFGSPCNRKKTKLLSTAVATPETRKPNSDPFDDNFSQFFRSQFIQQIDLDTSIVEKAQKTKGVPKKCEYEFTQIDGLSQFLDDSQFESSITSGQKFSTDDATVNEEEIEKDTENKAEIQTENEDEIVENENEGEIIQNENDPFKFELNEHILHDENNGENEDAADFDHDTQCSQMFLKELTTLQMNISSIVDETINANKFSTQDFLDPADGQFELFKSTVTESQYMHLKRPTESNENKNVKMPSTSTAGTQIMKTPARNTTVSNTEMIEDQLLAQMVFTTQTLARDTEILEDHLLAEFNEELDVSEKFNECIDPDSSALALLSDEEEKEKENKPKAGNKMEYTNTRETAKKIQERRSESANIGHSALQTVKQTETAQHSPVTAANFYSMGPFFGLPAKVKKLIRNFKNIDDLYGKFNQYFLSNTILIIQSNFIGLLQFRLAKGVSSASGY